MDVDDSVTELLDGVSKEAQGREAMLEASVIESADEGPREIFAMSGHELTDFLATENVITSPPIGITSTFNKHEVIRRFSGNGRNKPTVNLVFKPDFEPGLNALKRDASTAELDSSRAAESKEQARRMAPWRSYTSTDSQAFGYTNFTPPPLAPPPLTFSPPATVNLGGAQVAEQYAYLGKFREPQVCLRCNKIVWRHNTGSLNIHKQTCFAMELTAATPQAILHGIGSSWLPNPPRAKQVAGG